MSTEPSKQIQWSRRRGRNDGGGRRERWGGRWEGRTPVLACTPLVLPLLAIATASSAAYADGCRVGVYRADMGRSVVALPLFGSAPHSMMCFAVSYTSNMDSHHRSRAAPIVLPFHHLTVSHDRIPPRHMIATPHRTPHENILPKDVITQ